MIKQLAICGAPSSCGGADTELWHQIPIWKHLGIELHIVPSQSINSSAAKFCSDNAIIHNVNAFEEIKGMPVISFCNRVFLSNIEKIKQYSPFTLWVNCMTYPFPKEKAAHRKGLIDLHLYQTKHGRERITKQLEPFNKVNSEMFIPYFYSDNFPYIEDRSTSCLGRISRADLNKYMGNTIEIFERVLAPKEKEGIILGVNRTIRQQKLGKIPTWIAAYGPGDITQNRFYSKCSVLLQTSTCYENWPRVGLECMASGTALVVFKTDGWEGQVVHKETGYLCENPRDFIFYASHLLLNNEERLRIIRNAKNRLKDIAGLEASAESWRRIFNNI